MFFELRHQPVLYVFNDRQRRILRAHIIGENYQAAFDIGCMAGLRISEICNLNYRRGDIDFRNNLVKVYEGTKFNKYREVPLHPALKRMLKKYLRKHHSSFNNGYIFKSISNYNYRNRKHLCARSLQHAFDQAYDSSPYKLDFKRCKRGMLRHWTFHTSRHYFASKCIQAGFDILRLASILGHNDPYTTLAVYGHMFDNIRKTNYKMLKKIRF